MNRSKTHLQLPLLAAMTALAAGALMPAQAQTAEAAPADRSQIRLEAIERTREDAQSTVNRDAEPMPIKAEHGTGMMSARSATKARDVEQFHKEAIEQQGGQ